jgi:hypothetical protein
MSQTHTQQLKTKKSIPQLAGGNFPVFPGTDKGQPGWEKTANRWAKHVAILFFPWGRGLPPIPVTFYAVMDRIFEYRDSTNTFLRIYFEIIKDFTLLFSESKSDRTVYAKIRGHGATIWGDKATRDKVRGDKSSEYSRGENMANDMTDVLEAINSMDQSSLRAQQEQAELRLDKTRSQLKQAFPSPAAGLYSSTAPLQRTAEELERVLDCIKNGQLSTIDPTTSDSTSGNHPNSFQTPENDSVPVELNEKQLLAKCYIDKTMTNPAKQLLLLLHGGTQLYIDVRTWMRQDPIGQ